MIAPRCQWLEMRCLFIVLAFFSPLIAPSADPPWTIGARASYGFLWPHRPSSWILVEGHSAATEIFAERELRGKQGWQCDYLGPSYGFAFLYADMANPQRIGAAMRFVPYLHLPFTRGRRSSLGMQVGWGIGFVAKPYDRTENNKQIAIGSELNGSMHLMLQYRLRLGRTLLSTGLAIDHWSNGSVALPNLGLNLLTANVGIGYALGEVQPYVHVPDTTLLPRPRREQSVVTAFGINETARPLSGQHSVFVVTGQVQWRLTRKSSVATGIDLFNKGTLATLHPELEVQSRLYYTQLGVHGGYALGLGRGEMMFQIGMYAYSPMPDESLFFHRVGLRYRFGKHLVAHVALKTHYAVADHWEFGLGYRWN